jgi:hypothetical protein
MMITVTTIKKSTLAIVATLLFLFAVNTTSWAQASNTPAAGAKKYVRLDVGHGVIKMDTKPIPAPTPAK